jgi:hypothetical protein
MEKEKFKILMLALYQNSQLFIPKGQTIEDWIDGVFEDIKVI